MLSRLRQLAKNQTKIYEINNIEIFTNFINLRSHKYIKKMLTGIKQPSHSKSQNI